MLDRRAQARRVARGAFRHALPEATVARLAGAPAVVDLRVRVEAAAGACSSASASRRAIFNLGAGVDALLAVPTLPRDVPVIRLEDAGMAIQMAEYVTLAVLRAYREAATPTRGQQREARWQRAAQARQVDVLHRPARRRRARAGRRDGASQRSTSRFSAGADRRSASTASTSLRRTAGLRDMLAPLARARRAASVRRRKRGTCSIGACCRCCPRARMSSTSRAVRSSSRAICSRCSTRVTSHRRRSTSSTSEPLPPGHRFWHHPRIVITPHVSAATLVDDSVGAGRREAAARSSAASR